MENIDRAKIKEEAKAKIKGKVFNLLLANIITLALLGPVNGLPAFGQIVMIALSVVMFGLSFLYLNFIDNGKIDYMDLFYSFKVKDINTYLIHLGTIIVRTILIFLWTLLLIIPGIIKAIAYSQVNYIRAEKPDQDIMDCLKESENLMNGHKMEYFVLQLSFIGWFFLIPLTFGLVLIYLLPYYTATMTLYYRELRPKADEEIKPLSDDAVIS